MTLLPIVGRELRVASRRAGTYWGRALTALGTLLISAYVFFILREAPPYAISNALFSSLAWLAFLYCALAGPRLTADTLSEERREGTLGLLFLTDLRGYDIVLGKLTASSVNSCYRLLGIVPVMAIPLLLGGLSATQLWRTVLVLLVMLWASLGLGMLTSALAQNGRRAAMVSSLLVILLVLGPLVGAWMWTSYFGGARRLPLGWLTLSPAFDLYLALLPASAPATLSKAVPWTALYRQGLMLTGALGLICLVAASVIVARIWRDVPSIFTRWGKRSAARPATDFAQRGPLLSGNPFTWLALYDRQPGRVWLPVLAGVGGWAWAFANPRRGWIQDIGGLTVLGIVVSYGLHVLLKVWLTAASVKRLAEDRQSGALELLLSTPLTTRQVLAGQWGALLRQFAGPILFVLGMDLVLGLRAVATQAIDPTAPHLTILLFGAHMFMLVADAVTLGWLGQWMAMRTRGPSPAIYRTLAFGLALPWLLFLGLVTTVSLVSTLPSSEFDVTPQWFLGWWFMISLGLDLFWTGLSVVNLKHRFREEAFARYRPVRAALGQ